MQKRYGIQVPLYVPSRWNRKVEIEVKNSALNTNLQTFLWPLVTIHSSTIATQSTDFHTLPHLLHGL